MIHSVNYVPRAGSSKETNIQEQLTIKGIITGAVSCYGNEPDDLIVNKALQRQGFGQKPVIMHTICALRV